MKLSNRAFMPVRFTAALLCMIALSGCGDRGSGLPVADGASDSTDASGPESAETDRQSAFRVRGDFNAGLNDRSGWMAGLDQGATVQADQPFRLRFEVETSDNARHARRFRLEFRRNGGEWQPLPAENFPQPAKFHEYSLASLSNRLSDDVWRVESGNPERLSRMIDAAGESMLGVGSGESTLLATARAAVHWQPVEFGADIRFDEARSGEAGLVVEYRDADHYTRVDLVVPDTVRIVRVDNGVESILAERSAPVDTARWLTLQVAFDDRDMLVEFEDEALVFSVSRPDHNLTPMLGVYAPPRGTASFKGFVAEGEPGSPRSSIVSSPAFAHGAPTEDLLPVSEQSFSGGAGISFADRTPEWDPQGSHGEWEIPIVIRRFADEAAMNERGDRYEYRMVDVAHGALPTDSMASVTLDVPDRHLGGTFAETPMRLGPWQADSGDLYFPMEPSETWNRLMMVKSADGGSSWRETDGTSRPETGDLEGFASILAGDRIHMIHQTSDHVFYHAFNTADHPDSPDRWAVRDERLASPVEPPTQVADLAVRSDGSIVAVYGGPDDIRIRARSPAGRWGQARVIEPVSDGGVSGPTLVLGQDDIVHLAYTSRDGTGWYRKLFVDGELSDPLRFASDLGGEESDVGSILPLLYLAGSDSVSVLYRTSEGRLRERRIRSDGSLSEPVAVTGRRVVQNAVDSDQVGADAVVDGEVVHVLFIEQETGRLFHTFRLDGQWSDADLVVDGADVQWVRGALIDLPDVGRVYGFVYDAGSDGGSGMNRFGHVVLEGP